MNFYNDNDAGAVQWLRELVANGHLPHGRVDERPIQEITAPTSPASPPATSSPASAAGLLPCVSPAGPSLDLFGQPLAPASRSQRPGSGAAKPTKNTSGRCSFGSSESAALQRSLASRLQATTDTDGSPEYEMTWKKRAMQSGAPICRLAARARRTSGSGCSGWPTPDVPHGGQGQLSEMKQTGGFYRADGRKVQLKLQHVADLAGWPTPSAFETTREEAMRPSRAETGRTTGYLAEAVVDYATPLSGWATPTQRNHKHPNAKSFAERGGGKKGEQLANQVAHSGPTPSSSPAETEKRGVLNPAFSLWLQGYPAAWASCGARGIALCRKSRRSSSGRLETEGG